MYNFLTYLSFTVAVFGSKVEDEPTSIRGGDLASIEDYPFYAYLAYQSDNSILCGGSIIQRDLILTAAHCLVEDDFVVYAGINSKDDLKYATPYKIKAKIPYPGFDTGKSWFDIALLQLGKELPLGPSIGIIPLASARSPVGETASVVGFGKIGCTKTSWDIECTDSDHLRVAEVKIFKLGYRGTIKCFELTNSICHGDSGGPMIYDGELIGVSATVDDVSCVGGSEFAPVFLNAHWIRKYMKRS